MPLASGGDGASKAGGRVKDRGWRGGSCRVWCRPSWCRLGRGEVVGPVAATRTVAHDEIQEGGDDRGWFGSIGDVLTGEGRLVHGRAEVARVDPTTR